jgi:superfamily II DNA or RNA helicase
MMRSNFLRDINTFIYYTNSLSRNIKYTANLCPYVSNIDCSNNKYFEIHDDKKIFFIKLPYEENKDIIKLDIKPYSYQIEAFDKFNEHFINNNRGILSLPCGCGKTYTSYLISEKYSHIIIISPLKEFANQNLNRFIEYGYDKSNTLLVDSDGIRNVENIKEFIKEHKNLLISTTYNSMDLISNCLDLFNNPLFIIDEFHNLSKTNINDETNNIYKLLISNHKILFMSATPRIYNIEYDDDMIDID